MTSNFLQIAQTGKKNPRLFRKVNALSKFNALMQISAHLFNLVKGSAGHRTRGGRCIAFVVQVVDHFSSFSFFWKDTGKNHQLANVVFDFQNKNGRSLVTWLGVTLWFALFLWTGAAGGFGLACCARRLVFVFFCGRSLEGGRSMFLSLMKGDLLSTAHTRDGRPAGDMKISQSVKADNMSCDVIHTRAIFNKESVFDSTPWFKNNLVIHSGFCHTGSDVFLCRHVIGCYLRRRAGATGTGGLISITGVWIFCFSKRIFRSYKH